MDKKKLLREGGAEVTISVETSEGYRTLTRLLHWSAMLQSHEIIADTIKDMADQWYCAIPLQCINKRTE